MATFHEKRKSQDQHSSLLGSMAFDVAAECAVVCGVLSRPEQVRWMLAGLEPKHFYDPTLGFMYGQAEHQHCVNAVEFPYTVMPECLPAECWWAQNWEGEGRALFLHILEEYWDADLHEAVRTVARLAERRGVS